MEFLESLSSDLRMMLEESETSSDLLIECDGEKITAHRCILSARSPVFRAMLESEMVEGRDNIIKIQDATAEVMKQLGSFTAARQKLSSRITGP